MRIGVLTTSFPTGPEDHAGRFVATLCEALAARGHEVEVVAPRPAAPVGASPEGVEVFWAPSVRHPTLAHGSGIPDNVARSPARLLEAPALVAGMLATALRRRARWTGLLSHWLVPSAVLAEALRGTRPHVAVAHSADLWLLERLGRGGAAIARRALCRTTGVVVVSPHHAAEIRALSGGLARPRVMPMPPAAPTCARVPRRRRPPEPRLRVTVVARLVPVKGVDRAIEAVARPRAAGASLVVIGDGPERGRLEGLAAARGADVTFLGALSPERRDRHLESTDLLLVPGRRLPSGRAEGSPVAALEAMSAGIPVVASDVGGLRWLIGPGGLVVEPDSIDALAAAIGRLRDDPVLRDGLARAARRRARRFEAGRAAETIETLLFGGGPSYAPR